MDWLVWVLVSLVFYSLMPPLVKTAMREIPAYVSVTVTNGILFGLSFIVAKVNGYSFTEHLSLGRPSLMLYVAGVVLAVSVISYYNALAIGPISSVVPIWGMYIALSSLIGIIIMGERWTPAKGLGLVCALIAIFLLSR